MGSFFLIVFVAIGIGFALIFLLALSEKKRRGSPSAPAAFSRERFEKACVQIIEGMKLEIGEITRTGSSQLDILATNPAPITGGEYLVHCLYTDPGEVVSGPQIIELSNMVVQERLSKGIFITTGRFTADIPGIGELAPMEFIDGAAFEKLVKKYLPDCRSLY